MNTIHSLALVLITLHWTPSPSRGITGYSVWMATKKPGPYTRIGTTKPGNTNFSYSQPSGNHFYRVEAIAPACTPNTPVTQVCGNSPLSGAVKGQ